MMIGGETEIVEHLDPIFARLAPGSTSASPTPGRESIDTTADQGYLRCGRNGAGHFVKMVHNGIEHGVIAAYTEGLAVLRSANVGLKQRLADAETTPLRNPEYYQYDFDLLDIAEVWRRGSVINSWLLDLTAAALTRDSDLTQFARRVSNLGERERWTIKAAIDEGIPVPVLSSSLYARFASRSESDFQNKVLSAMRYAFGSGEKCYRAMTRHLRDSIRVDKVAYHWRATPIMRRTKCLMRLPQVRPGESETPFFFQDGFVALKNET